MGGFSKVVPKDYPTSPDIEDRRDEAQDTKPELVIRSAPAFPEDNFPSYKKVQKIRKQQKQD